MGGFCDLEERVCLLSLHLGKKADKRSKTMLASKGDDALGALWRNLSYLVCT